MPLEERELAYLWDIRDAAREIRSFMRGVKFVKFEKNKVLRFAAERQLLVIGEAAHHLSPQFRNKHPEIPWAKFIGMRNNMKKCKKYEDLWSFRVRQMNPTGTGFLYRRSNSKKNVKFKKE